MTTQTPDIWTILQTLGTALIYITIPCFTFYKAVVYSVDKWVASQVKVSTDFIDTRVELKLKVEITELKTTNKTLTDKIDMLEHDYKLFNEERIKEMREFFKEYK